MKNTTTKWAARVAATVSANLEELIQELPPGSELASDARRLADKIDRKFKLVSLSIPIGD